MRGVNDVVCPWCKKPLFLKMNNDGEIEKRCTNCGKWFLATREYYYANRAGRNGLQAQCKSCLREKAGLSKESRKIYRKNYNEINKAHAVEGHRKYYQTHKEQIIARTHVTQERRSRRLKREVLMHYGNGKLTCVRCGFGNVDALTIDHINGGGNKHRAELGRKGVSFYHWLKSNNYPLEYQTLCMNCQMVKGQEQYLEYQNDREEKKQQLESYTIRYSDDIRGYMKQYRSKHRNILRLQDRLRRQTLKKEILSHYGGGKCACVLCGYDGISALTIDHIGGNGHAHIQKIKGGFYNWLKNNGLPEGYQTLCMNCQFIKRVINKECGVQSKG